MVLGRRSAAEKLLEVAALYPANAPVDDALVPDFHSVRQAMNVASADQRVLVLVHGSQKQVNPLRQSLRSVSNDERIIGRFHFDFETRDDWKKNVKGLTQGCGVAVVKAGEFGLVGSTMQELPLTATSDEIIAALLDANQQFARTTEKKVYSTHVAEGRQQGIYFEAAVPYGEDRDGDGQIDHLGGRGPGSRRPGR